MLIYKCLLCGNETKNKKFCSYRCSGIWTRIINHTYTFKRIIKRKNSCLSCGELTENDRFCSRECSNSYHGKQIEFRAKISETKKGEISKKKGCTCDGKPCPNCNQVHVDMTKENNPSKRPEVGKLISKMKRGVPNLLIRGDRNSMRRPEVVAKHIGKSGVYRYVEDLGHYVQSSYEEGYCRELKRDGIPYQYHPYAFRFPSWEKTFVWEMDLVTYENGKMIWVEVKNSWNATMPRFQNKFDMFQKYYPHEPLRVVIYDLGLVLEFGV